MLTAAKLGRYLPLIIGIIILAVIALLAPWSKIGELLQDVPPYYFLLLTGLSVVYYAAKTLRFWYILRLLNIHTRLLPVALLYLSGQPLSILPAGELYRTVLLKKYLNISKSRSSPSVTIQGLVEAIVLLAISLFGAILIGKNITVVLVIAVLLAIVVIGLQRGWLGRSYALLDKLPYLSINEDKFQSFVKSHQQLLAPKSLSALVAFSLVPVMSGVGILYFSSKAIGQDVTFIQAMIGYSLPVILSGLSFLPGGLGVSEGGTIGILQLIGIPAAAAVTITLLVRVFSLVAGMVYGAIAQLILHARGVKA